MEGGAGNDSINGGSGNDSLFGNSGQDTVNGAGGMTTSSVGQAALTKSLVVPGTIGPPMIRSIPFSLLNNFCSSRH